MTWVDGRLLVAGCIAASSHSLFSSLFHCPSPLTAVPIQVPFPSFLHLPHPAPHPPTPPPHARCERCALIGDDTKLLLCDHCDRGFHTYCLDPVLAEIPEGTPLGVGSGAGGWAWVLGTGPWTSPRCLGLGLNVGVGPCRLRLRFRLTDRVMALPGLRRTLAQDWQAVCIMVYGMVHH